MWNRRTSNRRSTRSFSRRLWLTPKFSSPRRRIRTKLFSEDWRKMTRIISLTRRKTFTQKLGKEIYWYKHVFQFYIFPQFKIRQFNDDCYNNSVSIKNYKKYINCILKVFFSILYMYIVLDKYDTFLNLTNKQKYTYIFV